MMKEQRKANTFIVGGPKCGTTSLAKYLRTHSLVFVPDIKEPHFFSSDFNFGYAKNKNFEEYNKLFALSESEEILIDASTHYLFSETAINNILEYNPHAKFIVMVRDPAAMAASLHQQLCWTGVESEKNFEKAWNRTNLSKEKQQNEKVSDEKQLMYSEICKTGSQLNRLMEIVPKENLHVITLAELKEDPLEVYKNTLVFLGIEYDGKTSFRKENKAKVPRSRFLHYILTKKSQYLLYLIKPIKVVLGVKRIGLYDKVLALNSKHKKQSVDENFYKTLDRFFANERYILNNILNSKKLE